MEIKRGQIYTASLDGIKGSEQFGIRPVVIISNDIGNYFSPIVTIAPMTTRNTKKHLPTHVYYEAGEGDLMLGGHICCEQIRSISKERLGVYIGTLSDIKIKELNTAIKITLGL